MEQNKNWVNSVKSLYLWNLIAWSLATLILASKPIIDTLAKSDWVENPLQSLVYMALAFPGTLYFFLQSRKLEPSEINKSHDIFDRIMRVHTPTGIAGLAGAVLGLLPFLANILGPFSASEDLGTWLDIIWLNVGLLVPWVSLYGFVTFYVIAAVINKRRKKQRIESVTKS
jgi:predicted ferric reductase